MTATLRTSNIVIFLALATLAGAIRLYRPRKEIVDGTWKFPEAQPQ